jgi:hypothetical protein
MIIFSEDRLRIIFKHGNEIGLRSENNEGRLEELKYSSLNMEG